MVRVILFFVFMSLVCPFAYAASEDVVDGDEQAIQQKDSKDDKSESNSKNKSKKKKKKKKKKVKKNKAEKKPAKKKATKEKRFSTGLLAGAVINELVGYGFEFSMIHSPKLQYGVLVLNGSGDLKSRVESSDTAEVKSLATEGKLLLGQGRYFYSESLYSTFGFGMRSLTSEYEIGSSSSSNTATGNVTSSSLVINLSIGNRWTWGDLYFSADWVGWAQPLASSYSATTDAAGAVTSDIGEIQGKAEDYAVSLGQSGSFQLLVLNVGYIF